MKKMSVVLGLLLAVLVMGCGIYESYGFDYKQLSSIERGMSFKEVCTILGEPAFRDLNKEGRLGHSVLILLRGGRLSRCGSKTEKWTK